LLDFHQPFGARIAADVHIGLCAFPVHADVQPDDNRYVLVLKIHYIGSVISGNGKQLPIETQAWDKRRTFYYEEPLK